MSRRIQLLVVAQWPLGGIRTYMKYVYKYLPDHYDITILACSAQEDAALVEDAKEIGARLILHRPEKGKERLLWRVVRELIGKRYDVIQSQGFISAVNVSAANCFFGVPHVLTVHGILEQHYMGGRFAGIKKAILSRVLKHVDVLYAVSDDIMEHLHERFPLLGSAPCRKVVIKNGIDTSIFVPGAPERGAFRKELGIGNTVTLIGFLGRFMQQKGFNYLIDAAGLLESRKLPEKEYKIIAVGSGDYLDWYKKVVADRGLDHRFIFVPFRENVAMVYRDVDFIAMPSIWEASGLQAMEALCTGTPLIASNCIGLRETVFGTPALVVESRDARALARAMYHFITTPQNRIFEEFRDRAVARFDVRKTAAEVHRLLSSRLRPGSPKSRRLFGVGARV